MKYSEILQFHFQNHITEILYKMQFTFLYKAMEYNMYIPGPIIYIKYIKYELHRKYRTYLFNVFMACAVVHISEACILAQKIMP